MKEGLNFKIASGEETDSIFEQGVIGHKYEDPDVSLSSNGSDIDAYGEEECTSSDSDTELKAKDHVDSLPIDYSLKP